MSALHGAHKLYEVVKKIRDGPEEIQALQDQARLLANILPKIRDVFQREGDSTSSALLIGRRIITDLKAAYLGHKETK
ncbi:hypothetical protein PHLCEN_2v9974 [Hermanssonia centrifuga]|uniref:Uncharacterized protein n=1 Tax=Hermanssonia centrifuga TaxID=98765 RepID=A0A2R6NP85_9APHY|nr:hypothetical protein PHLCEN_2v9974 [Hermanssonia centrifuga]